MAKFIVEDLGGHLPTSTSAEKNAFLCSLVENDSVWLGGTDVEQCGIWRWITGEVWSYTNWDEDCPYNKPDNEAVMAKDYVMLHTNTGKWTDEDSDDYFGKTRKQICEWDYDFSDAGTTTTTETIDYHFISLESLVDIYTPAEGDSSKVLTINGYTITFHVSNVADNAITVQNDGLHVDISGKTDKVVRNPLLFNPYDPEDVSEAQNYAEFNTNYTLNNKLVLLDANGNIKDSGITFAGIASNAEVAEMLNNVFN